MTSLPPPPPPGGAPPPPPPPPPTPSGPSAAPYGYESWTTPRNERASFWRRLASTLLDGVLYVLALAAALIPAIVFIGLAVQDCTTDDDGNISCPDGTLQVTPLVVGIVLGVAAFIGIAVLYIRSLGRRGTTWGRVIVGIRVVDVNTGQPIGIPRALGRTLFANIFSSSIFYLGYLWMLWDKNRQTWHDKVTDSTVVRT